MNLKKSLLLLVVAAILCLAVYLDYSSKPHGDKVTQSASGEALEVKAFEKVTPDTIVRIEVLAPGKKDPVILTKDSGEWKVQLAGKLYRLSKDRAERLFGKTDNKVDLNGALTLDFQARNPENHGEFNLTDDKATRVKFFGDKGDVVEDILIGKNGPDWQTTFVRFPGKNEVYLAPVRLSSNFTGADANDWRDKRLFPDIPYEGIYRVFVDDRANTRTYVLEKQTATGGSPEETWWLTEPSREKARATSAQSVARTLANLTAVDFVTTPNFALAGFENPTLIARFDVKDHPTTPVLTIGAETEKGRGRFFAKSNLSNETYVIYRPYAVAVAPDSLKETPTPTPSPTPTASPTVTPPPDTSAQEGTTTGTKALELKLTPGEGAPPGPPPPAALLPADQVTPQQGNAPPPSPAAPSTPTPAPVASLAPE